jgi:hypothetical protein
MPMCDGRGERRVFRRHPGRDVPVDHGGKAGSAAMARQFQVGVGFMARQVGMAGKPLPDLRGDARAREFAREGMPQRVERKLANAVARLAGVRTRKARRDFGDPHDCLKSRQQPGAAGADRAASPGSTSASPRPAGSVCRCAASAGWTGSKTTQPVSVA